MSEGIEKQNIEAPEPVKVVDNKLYERIGGYDTIASFVDDIFKFEIEDHILGRFFNNLSRDSKKKIRQHLVDFLCEIMEGPCFYVGRDMKTVHTGLDIMEKDWDIFIKIVVSNFGRYNIQQIERKEILAILSGIKQDIIGL